MDEYQILTRRLNRITHITFLDHWRAPVGAPGTQNPKVTTIEPSRRLGFWHSRVQ